MKRTYIDSGVLIAAARGKESCYARALGILSDAAREFVCSDYVKMETVPKPTYFGYVQEVRFYEEFFLSVKTWLTFDKSHLDEAYKEACVSGLSSLDAVHVVLASLTGCDELVTSEKSVSAIHRTKKVSVVSIDFD